MPEQRDPFMWVARGTVHDGQDLVLVTEPIRNRDQVLYCDEISVCNRMSSGGDVELGLVQGGRYNELDTIFNLDVNMWHWGLGKFTFLSPWQIYARFIYEENGNGDPCGDGDDCELHVVGYTLEPYSTP